MKKKLLTIAVTAAMVFSLVACGSNGGSNETKAVETSASETAAESAVSEGDGEKTLKAGATTGFFGAESLDPANNWDGWIMSIYGISENLFRLDDNLAPQPWLVDSYENTDDTTWVFTLKDGISAVGLDGPSPRNDKPAILSIKLLTSRAAVTISGETIFGSIYLKIIAVGPAPHIFAALIYSESLIDKTRLRDSFA